MEEVIQFQNYCEYLDFKNWIFSTLEFPGYFEKCYNLNSSIYQNMLEILSKKML